MVQDELLQNTDLDELESISVNDEKIEKRRLRPLASFLDFDVSHRPTQAKDRISKHRVCRGIVLGVVLIALGLVSELGVWGESSMFSKIDNLPLPATAGTFSASWLLSDWGCSSS